MFYGGVEYRRTMLWKKMCVFLKPAEESIASQGRQGSRNDAGGLVELYKVAGIGEALLVLAAAGQTAGERDGGKHCKHPRGGELQVMELAGGAWFNASSDFH